MEYSKDQYYKMQQMLANQAYGAGDYGAKQPFYMTYPVQSLYMTEMEYEKDMERMKDLYPKEAKKILEYVEEECDRMEYDGSLMFDEYPDRLMLRRICDRIYGKVTEDKESVSAQQYCRECRPGGPPPPPPHGGRPPRDDGKWNLIEVLLYNEMYKRRCRYKRCRRWW